MLFQTTLCVIWKLFMSDELKRRHWRKLKALSSDPRIPNLPATFQQNVSLWNIVDKIYILKMPHRILVLTNDWFIAISISIFSLLFFFFTKQNRVIRFCQWINGWEIILCVCDIFNILNGQNFWLFVFPSSNVLISTPFVFDLELAKRNEYRWEKKRQSRLTSKWNKNERKEKKREEEKNRWAVRLKHG